MQLLTLSLHSLTLAALGATIYLYYYTAFCGWKWKDSETRMLFLADPQIEGDSKVRKQGIRGEIDLIANDIFIRHVYTSFVSPYSLFTQKPTHSIILGDLFSSQWINDQEFERRVKRYKWIFGDPRGEYKHEFINLTGNHDIGYNRDITKHRADRWEKEFGKMSFNRRIPSKEQILSTNNIDEDNKKYHRLAVINSMNIDGPAWDEQLRYKTWSFLDELAEEREQENYQTPLILLMHIPIFKKEGLCVDGPMTVVDEHKFIIEQNHLSYNASKFILTKLKPKFIFAGHDHEGCDITHVIHMNDDGEYSLKAYRTFDFEARKKEFDYSDGDKTWIIREITVRSVMGEFGGNAGLFEIHKKTKDDGNEEFEYNYSSCPFVINHIPWVIIITDIILLLGFVIYKLFWVDIVKIFYKLKTFIYNHYYYQQLDQKQKSQSKSKITRRNSKNNFRFNTKNICYM
ncbi:hypothetical protein Glove_53g92 [Diversispora epigaea]|uniref:Calcineurin-like phosphoesterase domain-containing protein n=1 Tax=Diversispora epigaea TaxID=1348612 RepID=A0A397JP34_9GLOM|nr:hypothetical protein Glove_53g92 [Diversispora epigaea]